MLRRTRFLAGLAAMAAMTLSLAAGVAASVCAPAVELATAIPSAAHVHDASEAELPEPDCMDREPGQDEPSPCPLAPFGAAQSCVAVASLPAITALVPMSAREQVHHLPTIEREPVAVAGAALFHPPRS